MYLCHLLKEPLFCFAFSEVFKLCEAKNINFVEYFMTDKHFFEQMFRKVEPESFLYKFLNSGDPLYKVWYTSLTNLLARWARLGRTHGGSGNHAEKYSSISPTNQRQIS